MKKYTFVTRPDETSAKIEQTIRDTLNQNGFKEDILNPEVVIVIGGDGTFIMAVHDYINKLNDVCFYGIHTGTLGFYTDYRDSDLDEFLEALISGKTKEIRYPLLGVDFDGKVYHAINEIRLENVARTQILKVYINDEMFEEFHGTGMCVCTQLGSTAYNRSLGGAVIQEGLDFIELTEISGIHHSKCRTLNAPIVLHGDTKIRFESNSFDHAIIGADSFVYQLKGARAIEIQICDDIAVRVLRGRKVNYFSRLKSLF